MIRKNEEYHRRLADDTVQYWSFRNLCWCLCPNPKYCEEVRNLTWLKYEDTWPRIVKNERTRRNN